MPCNCGGSGAKLAGGVRKPVGAKSGPFDPNLYPPRRGQHATGGAKLTPAK